MTILVTGATGLVGTRLIPRLVDAGHDVRALVRAGKTVSGVDTVEGDLLDPTTLPGAVDGVDQVVHLAAVLRTSDPADVTRANVDGTSNLIAAVAEHAPAARTIMASTGLVYAADLPRPAREGDPTTAPMPYPASKVVAEQALRDSGLTWSILRFGFVYGDGDGHLQAAPGLLGSWGWHPAATLSLVHHRDIATAMLLALDGGLDCETVNVADDAPATVADIARLVGAAYPESNAPLENPFNGHVDSTRLRELGFTPAVRSMYQAAAERSL
ncbi:NAD-dependent epimerase/dehydratase family protein [Homoserinibacter sp. YIM 151385]|uniref:NAD-dependent epimerase/dehydratase family protein n=1 Tax=Homoserinibacter sp. YIM 151385 TaxID=2985506 RepID=UPI0022F11098|nr:NAD(P)-dependent oxidoreductase [Homoserinibacter sp. YIM 151385]WBU38797.1 NAD(P)-dependent oxidoreductase [Homoserinibacter sp. YIM 151385]